MGHQLLTVYDQGVTGVRPPAKTSDYVGKLGVKVDHLALAFIAPLSPDDHDVCHCPISFLEPKRSLQSESEKYRRSVTRT